MSIEQIEESYRKLSNNNKTEILEITECIIDKNKNIDKYINYNNSTVLELFQKIDEIIKNKEIKGGDKIINTISNKIEENAIKQLEIIPEIINSNNYDVLI